MSAFASCKGLMSVTFQGTIPVEGFDANAFRGLGGIRSAYFAGGGGPGTYTRPNNTSGDWRKR